MTINLSVNIPSDYLINNRTDQFVLIEAEVFFKDSSPEVVFTSMKFEGITAMMLNPSNSIGFLRELQDLVLEHFNSNIENEIGI